MIFTSRDRSSTRERNRLMLVIQYSGFWGLIKPIRRLTSLMCSYIPSSSPDEASRGANFFGLEAAVKIS